MCSIYCSGIVFKLLTFSLDTRFLDSTANGKSHRMKLLGIILFGFRGFEFISREGTVRNKAKSFSQGTVKQIQ